MSDRATAEEPRGPAAGLPGPGDLGDTALWAEARQTPDSVAATLDVADGHAEVAALLASPTTRRIVVTGNGASWYVATAFWLAALEVPTPCPVVAVPAGILATGGFRWARGDLVLGFSSSGELRDLVELMSDHRDLALALVTAAADSSLGARARARALVTVRDQHAITHTQAYAGAAAVAFDLLGRWASRAEVRSMARLAPEVLARQLGTAAQWAQEAASELQVDRSAVVFGANQASVAALEAALFLKEVAGIPAEGMEVREAATTGMYALNPDDLVLALPVGQDSVAAEAEAVCGRRGGTVRRAPWPDGAPPTAAVFGHFAHPLALSIQLALDRGRDPDDPGWWADYESTARRSNASDRATTSETPSPPAVTGGDEGRLRSERSLVASARFQRLENVLAVTELPRPDAVDLTTRSRLLDCAVGELISVQSEMAATVDRQAAQLLADPEVAAAIERLGPSLTGPLVVCGDSITADWLSWAEILQRVLVRQGSVAKMFNVAVSGGTTADLLARLSAIGVARPQLVIALIGTNDARRHGVDGVSRMTSLAETVRNLEVFTCYVTRHLGARLLLLTPPPIDETRERAFEDFVAAQVSWRAQEVSEIAEMIRTQDGVIDVETAFATGSLDELLIADGVHPSVAGQTLIARMTILRLALMSASATTDDRGDR